MPRGFILQPTYRIESGQPVVHLYGVLDSGGTFLLRDTRCIPHFWIRRDDAEAARARGAARQTEDPTLRSLDDHPVVRVDVRIPADAPPLRDRLFEAGLPCYEADVRFAYRYLIEHGLRGSLFIDDDGTPGRDVGTVFENPPVRPAAWAPRLSVLSIDIETDPRASQLLSVALVGCGADEVMLLTPEGMTCPPGASAWPDERSMLEGLVRRIRELDPDVITGWNVVGFDLAVLLRLAERHGVALTLGRDDQPLRLREASGGRASQQAVLTGRLVLDGIDTLRGAFVRLDDYSLNGAAREILGRQKLITGQDRGEQILRAFHDDRPHLVEYNRLDAQLVLDILDKLQLIELSVQRSLLTGLPPDRVSASVSAFDFLYLSALGPRRIVAPTVRPVPGLESQGGGHVLDPRPGLYRNALLLDFKSLYPSLIRTFNIDPVALCRGAPPADAIAAPGGGWFDRTPGILPALLDDLFPKREAAKAAGDKVASHAIKILMNSFYGVLGTTSCRFASARLVNAITGFGREILLWSKRWIETAGHEVLYGDTDSLFVLSGHEDPDAALATGARLASDLNEALKIHLRERWQVESRLELEFEKLYLRLFLPMMRGGGGGARKRYAGLRDGVDGPEVEFTGLEAVRRDWTALAKRVQRELYERLFADRPVEDFLRETVRDVRAGSCDEELVYRKGLRRRLESYTTTTPPHVVAARKLSHRPGRVISYVMTTDGPEPTEVRHSPLDHEHYVQKQVRAVADPVLQLLELEFDEVVGDEKQLKLF